VFLATPVPRLSEPGIFLIDMMPTVRGIYDLQLQGSINDTPVDVIIQLDEVLLPAAVQFPETVPDAGQLASNIAELQDTVDTQLASLQTLAYVGIAAGVIGIGIAIFALVRRK
jgi:hypothetical protein